MADEAKAASGKKVNLVSQEGDAYEVRASLRRRGWWWVEVAGPSLSLPLPLVFTHTKYEHKHTPPQ